VTAAARPLFRFVPDGAPQAFSKFAGELSSSHRELASSSDIALISDELRAAMSGMWLPPREVYSFPSAQR